MIKLEPNKRYTPTEIEKIIKDDNDPISFEAVQYILERYIAEEFMSKLGYLLNSKNMTFEKFSPTRKDIQLFISILENQENGISSEKAFQQLKLVVNTMKD